MRIKFIQTTPSDSPDYPFVPGQVIDVEKMTRVIRQWVADGAAFVLAEAPIQTAVKRDTERAVRA